MKYPFSILGLLIAGIIFILFIGSCHHESDTPPNLICFQKQVFPILAANCATSGCHGKNGESDIKIISYNSIMDADIIVKGKPFKSKLYNVITTTDKIFSQPMPPKHRLTDEQINYIYVWILQGAQNTNCNSTCDTCTTPPTCDSTNITYNGTIKNIISNYCAVCHTANSDNPLTNYSEVLNIANEGKIEQMVINYSGENPMPPSGKLNSCQIAQIKNWLNNGKKLQK